MAKINHLLDLIKSHNTRNEKSFRNTIFKIIEYEKSVGREFNANRIREALISSSNLGTITGTSSLIQLNNSPNEDLFEIIPPRKSLKDVILPGNIRTKLESLIYEIKNRDRLNSWGIKNFGRILLYGKPGTGKTLTAFALSGELGYDLIYVKLDSLISSYLGQTSNNIKEIFDFAKNERMVLFIDEFDAIGKMRDDPRELGEIKRVVNSLIQNIDNFESETILVASTNHPQLLDSAIWRRFDEIIYFPTPNKKQREEIFKLHTKKMRLSNVDFPQLSELTEGYSGYDISNVVRHAARVALLRNSNFLIQDDFISAISTIKSNGIKNLFFRSNVLNRIDKERAAKKMKDRGKTYKQIGSVLGISPTTAWRYNNKT